MKEFGESRLNSKLNFKVFSILAASLVIMGGLIGCDTESDDPPQTSEPAAYPMTITDHADRTVTISAEPTKIISLVPSHTEIVFELGLGDSIVGVDDYSDYPAAALTTPKVGNLYGVNYEAIVAKTPDMILVDISAVGLGVVAQLAAVMPDAAIIVAKGTSVGSFQEVYETIDLIGKVTNTGDAADTIVEEMKARVKAITDKTSGLTSANKPRTVYIIWPEPMYVYGGHAIGSALIEAAGGTNIFADNQGDAVQLEELVSRNPQVILASASEAMGDYAYQFALSDTRLDTTDAKIDGAIYGMNDDFTGRPGPRLIDGLEEMAKLLHPELFT